MRRRTLKNRLFSTIALFLPVLLTAQNPSDCVGSIVVCGDTDIQVPDSAGDVLDFNDPDNDLGCHLTAESSAVWLYFRFREDMPPGSSIEFTIAPFEGGEVDYDFSLFAADLPCDSLGSPERCSYSWAISNTVFDCGFCPLTGLGNGQTDFTEGPFGDGYVAPLTVEPGQGFYLYINEFANNSGGSSISDGFNITFGGSAAPFLDCGANPNCEQQVVALGQDTTVCSGDVPFLLEAEVTFATGFEQYTWTGFDGATAFLDDPGSPSPALSFPDNFSGPVTYELEVASGDCINYDTITLFVAPTPVINVPRDTVFCEGETLLLDAGAGFDSYLWSTGDTTQTLEVDEGGVYNLTVTPASGACVINRSINVEQQSLTDVQIIGDSLLCAGTMDTLFAPAGFTAYSWTGGSNDSFLLIDQPGLYRLEVVSQAGCRSVDSIQVELAPVQSLTIDAPAGLCPQETDSLSAGSWATYLWEDGSTDSLLTVTAPGTYGLTVTDENGCIYTDNAQLSAFSSPDLQIAGEEEFCFGSSTLLLATQLHETYAWSTGDTTMTTIVDESGEYAVTVTNAAGCQAADTLTVTELPPVSLTVDLLNAQPLCEGDTVFAQVLPAFEAYNWEGGATGPVLPVSSSGTYRVTVTDAQGCTGVDSISVNAFPLPEPAIVGPDGLCPDTTGTLSVQSFDLIDWGGGDDGPVLPISGPGQYSVTVTDIVGCSAADTIEVLAYDNPLPASGGDTSLCEGGSLEIQLDSDYATYAWEGGADSPTLTVDAPGDFPVTVTNAEGCFGSTVITVAEFPNPQLALPAQSTICEGDSLEVGPSGTYSSYAWSNGATDAAIVVSQASDYSLTVTNVFGCTAADTLTLEVLALPDPGLEDSYGFCAGGSVVVSATEGLNDYEWSTSETGASISINTAGAYQLTVTDANGCQRVDSIEVIENALPQPALIGGGLLCADSSLLLQSAEPYTAYEWQDGSNADSFLVQAAGAYSLTVTDANGCQGTVAQAVEEVPLPVVDLPVNPVFCEGRVFTLDAGTDGLSFNWSTGAETQSIQITEPGPYAVTVTDANGCVNTAATDAAQLPRPDIEIEGERFFCFSESTTLQLSDTTYSIIDWSSGGNGNSETIETPGNYVVAVLDSNNCSAELPFTIEELPPVDAGLAGPSDICFGDTATFTAAAGFQSYEWSDGTLGDTLQAEETGVYGLTVTDAQGCTGEAAVNLFVSPFPTLGLPDTLFFCEDASNTLSVSSDHPVALEWSTGETTPQIEVDTEGLITLTATNPFGCTTAAAVPAVEIPEPDPVLTGDLSICPGYSALLTLQEEYTSVLWSTGETADSILVSEPGAYQVTVTNEGGCDASTNIIIQPVPAPEVSIAPVPSFCTGDSITLQATASNGVTYDWSAGSTASEQLVNTAGTYAVTVTNVFGCIAVDSLQVEAYPQPDPDTPDELADCAGETVSFSADNGFVSYAWNTGSQQPAITADESGLYIVSVTDNNGCIGTDTTEVRLESPTAPGIEGVRNICLGNSTVLEVIGEWESILWSTGADSTSITIDSSGSYWVQVTDSLGCSAISGTAVQIFPIEPPLIDGKEGLCPGESTVLAAPPGYASYSWNTGAETSEIEVSQPGMYEVTVIDTVGCLGEAKLALKAFELPDIEIEGDPFLCPESTNELRVTEDQGAILWSNGATAPLIEVVQPGTYSVAVTNQDNCTARDTLQLAAVDSPVADVGSVPVLDCDTPEVPLGSEGGSSLPLIYQWAGPDINADNQNQANPIVSLPGTYTLVVVDSLTGCISGSEALQLVDLSYVPELSLSVNDTLDCNTPTVSLSSENNAGGPVAYQWWGPDGSLLPDAVSDTYEAGEGGIYTLLITDLATGCQNQITVEVPENTDIPTAIINPNVNPLTCADTVVTISTASNSPSGAYSLSWAMNSPDMILANAGSASLKVDRPGEYFFIVTDTVNGCQAIDSVEVIQDIQPPDVVLSVDGELGCLDEFVTISAEGSDQGGGFSYVWSGPNGFSATGQLPQEVGLTGLYTLTVLSLSNGCEGSASAVVATTPNSLQDAELLVDSPDCREDEVGQIQVGSVIGGTPPYVYAIDQEPFSAQQFFTGLLPGTYEITVQDAAGCEITVSADIEPGQGVSLDLGEDQVIQYGEEVELLGITNLLPEEISSIVWQPADSAACDSCLSWIDQPTETTTYYATITDTFGCQATDEVLVRVLRLRRVYIPDIFSPNNDGANDFFTVFSGEEAEVVEQLRIYDRWGNEVFVNTDFPPNRPEFGWNGRFRGEPMNIGQFVYFAEVRFRDGATVLYKGGVTLAK